MAKQGPDTSRLPTPKEPLMAESPETKMSAVVGQSGKARATRQFLMPTVDPAEELVVALALTAESWLAEASTQAVLPAAMTLPVRLAWARAQAQAHAAALPVASRYAAVAGAAPTRMLNEMPLPQ